ncbi:MAG: LysE family translocator [Rhodobacteraceae bacterium]|nr:LysE family translocator [Paracoccaceae bacterium]
MTLDLTALLTAWSIQAAGALSPGPGVAMLLGVASSRGRAPALLTALGIGCAAIILATITVVGFSALLAEMSGLLQVMRWLGAGYLLWLAYGAFRRAASTRELTVKESRPRSPFQTWLSGFVLQMSNPKALFFWLAIAAVGGLQAANTATLTVFVAGAFVISLVSHGGWALLLSSTPFRRLYQRGQRYVETMLGGFFAFASFKIFTAET